VLYHYFDFRDGPKTTYTGILSSLLFQIGTTVAEGQIQTLYQQSKQSQITNAVMKTFVMTNIPRTQKTYIVIDAFDECQDQHDTAKLIQEMLDIGPVHIFVSCRYTIQDLQSDEILLLDEETISNDIGCHIDEAFKKRRIKFPSMKNEIKTVLLKGARGV